MRVTVQVNEVDVNKLSAGQTGKVTFSALPDVTLDATIDRIATTATSASPSPSSGEGASGGTGVVTYAVELVISDPDANVKPGMTANVKIVTERYENVLTVPAAARERRRHDGRHRAIGRRRRRRPRSGDRRAHRDRQGQRRVDGGRRRGPEGWGYDPHPCLHGRRRRGGRSRNRLGARPCQHSVKPHPSPDRATDRETAGSRSSSTCAMSIASMR